MSIYYYEPFYNFDRLFDAFIRPAGQLLQATQDAAISILEPKMDLHEDATRNTVTASLELPGLKKEDGRNIPSERGDNGYAVRERRYGKFSRTLRLPQGIKEEEIKASLAHGLLTVTFPKAAPETTPKNITIS
ncbi:HSP20-like chaperone [Desarmillaria ectypa]|nr:HSP20-like chaperone [Desarmillaria ectypa]